MENFFSHSGDNANNNNANNNNINNNNNNNSGDSNNNSSNLWRPIYYGLIMDAIQRNYATGASIWEIYDPAYTSVLKPAVFISENYPNHLSDPRMTINIISYIKKVSEGDFLEAAKLLNKIMIVHDNEPNKTLISIYKAAEVRHAFETFKLMVLSKVKADYEENKNDFKP